MSTREDLAGWLDGPPRDTAHVPGSTWGLPQQGPGSVAGYGRRFISLCLDWGASLALSALVFQSDALATLLIFVAQLILMQTLFGASIGQFITGLRVRPVTGQLPMIARATIRSLVMLTLISALVRSRDLQPLHDMAAGTAVVRA
ncbi:MAG: RDD family protein [Dermabacter sp.]|nr:RDD family protein [Dermabacter sp.]